MGRCYFKDKIRVYFRKLLKRSFSADFENGTADTGLYNLSQTLRFYSVANGANNVFAENVYAQVVLTRDAANKQVTGYVDGTQEIQFTDDTDLAVIDAANTLRFLLDDELTQGEESGGAVARIRIDDGVLTPAEVGTLDRTHTDCTGPADVTYQNTDHRIEYSSWVGASDGAASGGTHRMSKATGASAFTKFTGTSVRYHYLAGPTLGKVQIYIDKVLVKTICQYAPTPTAKSKNFKNLVDKKHKVEIRVLNQTCKGGTETLGSVDKIVANALARQDTALKWQWNGWLGKASASANGGSYHAVKRAEGYAKFAFDGIGIDVMTLKGPAFGKMDVYIDDILIDTLDLSNANLVALIKEYAVTDGPHTIELRRNASSVAPKIIVDGFRVTGSP